LNEALENPVTKLFRQFGAATDKHVVAQGANVESISHANVERHETEARAAVPNHTYWETRTACAFPVCTEMVQAFIRRAALRGCGGIATAATRDIVRCFQVLIVQEHMIRGHATRTAAAAGRLDGNIEIFHTPGGLPMSLTVDCSAWIAGPN
jgi:hypothetical protein